VCSALSPEACPMSLLPTANSLGQSTSYPFDDSIRQVRRSSNPFPVILKRIFRVPHMDFEVNNGIRCRTPFVSYQLANYGHPVCNVADGILVDSSQKSVSFHIWFDLIWFEFLFLFFDFVSRPWLTDARFLQVSKYILSQTYALITLDIQPTGFLPIHVKNL
jgi:hypothetical protein